MYGYLTPHLADARRYVWLRLGAHARDADAKADALTLRSPVARQDGTSERGRCVCTGNRLGRSGRPTHSAYGSSVAVATLDPNPASLKSCHSVMAALIWPSFASRGVRRAAKSYPVDFKPRNVSCHSMMYSGQQLLEVAGPNHHVSLSRSRCLTLRCYA